jgi:hypothetical protein
MISTLTSLSVPPQIVTGIVAGGLILILMITHLLDNTSQTRKFASCFKLFSAPLLIFFGFAALIYTIRVLTS